MSAQTPEMPANRLCEDNLRDTLDNIANVLTWIQDADSRPDSDNVPTEEFESALVMGRFLIYGTLIDAVKYVEERLAAENRAAREAQS